MKLKSTPELHNFFVTYISDAEMGADDQVTKVFCESASSDRLNKMISEAKRLLDSSDFPIDELGSEANRWFGDEDEARAWLQEILSALESSNAGGGRDSSEIVVKDSNGAILTEGDTVLVIKDLKVKGGSSDLKRGTMIKNIHVIDDAENIECRVNGSTLVLKTCFLKKA